MDAQGGSSTGAGSKPAKRSARRALRFTRIELENWRNFLQVDVALQRRVILVGPNASGKSNLIDAFRFLHDIAAVGGGLQAAVADRSGVSSLRCLAARRYSDVSVRVSIGTDEQPTEWIYDLSLSQDNQRRPVIKRERVSRSGETILDRPDGDDEADPERKTQTFLEQVNSNRSFRDVADFLNQVRYRHLVPQLIREPDRSVGHTDDPFGGDFLEQISATQSRTREARLRRITEALQVAVPQLKELEQYRDDGGTPHIRGRYEHWRPQGAWQTEEQFSDGSLRLLGLLWAVLDGTGPLLLEEPELSLHPEVVRYLPQLFARVQRSTGRQLVMSTHSPDLLDDDGMGLDEVLLLRPSEEGTAVEHAATIAEVRALLEAGVPLSELLMPQTRPAGVEQLAFFR